MEQNLVERRVIPLSKLMYYGANIHLCVVNTEWLIASNGIGRNINKFKNKINKNQDERRKFHQFCGIHNNQNKKLR